MFAVTSPFNLSQGTVVGNRNFEVGKKRPIPGSVRASVKNSPGENGTGFEDENHPKIEQGKTCGAMSEQHGQRNESSPQKFIHLIGCRDPRARTRTRTHPR
jgi:hypothetical protein